MKRIPKTPQRAKRSSKVDDLRFNAQKRGSKVDDLRFNAQKRSSKVDDLRFNAQKRSYLPRLSVHHALRDSTASVDDLRFKSTAFWPFPKPKNLEQWWWAITIGVILVTYAYIVLFSILLAP